ncbi:stage II sporulation protein M [Methanosalsum natronophilum]|uniref:stage II sporulation protein M n=1 Tax=Methanosalsum natronophilum TaxID=768733 RepID=UPI002166F51E|nr:stage II sporulation protein M [Methanosalsum natronophilum]MCS3924397.1 putative membrane protein SpoIIM required for sporulation [Methanosalsum natronophilum]
MSYTITETASASVAKVTVTAQYTSLIASIILYNTIAMIVACTGSALILKIHSIMLNEFKIKKEKTNYLKFSLVIERILRPLYDISKYIIFKVKPDIHETTKIADEHKEISDNSIWHYSAYTKEEHRLFSYILPFIVPLLVLFANGTLLGILFTYINFNNAIIGYNAMGIEGILFGVGHAMVFFTSSIILHGLIELPVIFFAIAIGYKFAKIQSNELIKNDLFIDDNFHNLLGDVKVVNSISKEFLLSSHLWTFLIVGFVLLSIAAFIEVNYTPSMVELALENYYKIIENNLIS